MKFTKTVLDNGLTILHEKRDVPVTTLMLATRYGAAHETATDKGMAHFIEHLCFKGTEKRDVHEIASAIEDLGGDLNAFTHEEITAYHAKISSKHLETAADVIFDIFFNATFPKEEITKEAQVVCEEIKMYRDSPRIHVIKQIKHQLYETPFGMSIGGTEENVKAMNQERLMKRHREVYTPQNAILCVVGNNEYEEVLALAKKHCIERTYKETKPQTAKEKIETTKEERESINQTNIAMGIHFPTIKDNKRYAAEIFCDILGQGMTSRLFKEVREKRGLVYSVRSEIDSGNNYGYLLIWAGTDPTKKEEVYNICEQEYRNMKNVSEEELQTAKKRLIGAAAIDNESSNDTAVHLTLEEIWGDAQNYYEYEQNINNVSIEDVRAFAEKGTFAKFSLEPTKK